MSYENKRKALFDSLLDAEKCVSGTSLEQSNATKKDEIFNRNQSKITSKKFRGRESIFKRPELPITKCLKPRRAPDYQVRRNQ